MNNARLVRAITHLAGLGVVHRAFDVRRHRAHLGVRHQAARPENLSELTDDPHRIRRRNDDVEIELSGLHGLCEVLEPDHVGTRRFRLLGVLALGEYGDPHGLARAVRQNGRAADHLVRLAGIDAEIHRHIDALGELRRGEFLDQRQRLVD